jgi:hypothetical protein
MATPPRTKHGMVSYTAHELRHVCASLLIASGATDMQVAHQMGHSKIETTKNIYGHLFAQDRSSILDAMNEAVGRLYVNEDSDDAAELQAADPQPSRTRTSRKLRPRGSLMSRRHWGACGGQT